MASSKRIHLDTTNTGLWRVKQTSAAAERVSQLLQEDMEQHHVFFNAGGYHNHISHHLYSLYGTGASADDLQLAYDANVGYQLKARPPRNSGQIAVDDPHWFDSPDGGRRQVGRGVAYSAFLLYFQQAIERSPDGWPDVVKTHLLSGTATADDLLVRLFGGLVHPLLQLQFGLEFGQAATVAQGLAQTSVHRREGLDEYFLGVERRKTETTEGRKEKKETTEGRKERKEKRKIKSLYEMVANNPDLATAAHMTDNDKIRDGVLRRAGDAMQAVAALVHVDPTEEAVAERTAEMAETVVFMATSAALHPNKLPKYDFFLIHHVNAIPFFLTINSFDWVPVATKARLLEWKIRLDLLEYAARGCPSLEDGAARVLAYDGGATPDLPDNIPETQAVSRAAAIAAARIARVQDDGHAIKLVRALGLAEQAVKAYGDASWRTLPTDGHWEAIHRLAADSVLSSGAMWVRSAGFEEAWEDIPDR